MNSGQRYRECWRQLWAAALRDGQPRCHYCGVVLTPRTATIDHLTPTSRGGAAYDTANMALCCLACNQAKGDKTEQEYRQSL